MIWHILDILVSVATIGVAYFLGKHRRYKPYKEEKPICGCDHHYSFHDEEEGCHFISDYKGQCGCQRYIGPEPLPKVIA